MSASAPMQAWLAVRRQLPDTVGAWRAVLQRFGALAEELAARWLPQWYMPLGDRSAFEAEQRAALRFAAELRAWDQSLDGADPEDLLDSQAVQDLTRAVERVVLALGAWDEGAAVLDRALAALPVDLLDEAEGLVETGKSWWPVLAAGAGAMLVAALLLRR